MRKPHKYSKDALDYIRTHGDKVHEVVKPSTEWNAWVDYWKAHSIPYAYNLKVGKADVPTLWPKEFDPEVDRPMKHDIINITTTRNVAANLLKTVDQNNIMTAALAEIALMLTPEDPEAPIRTNILKRIRKAYADMEELVDENLP